MLKAIKNSSRKKQIDMLTGYRVQLEQIYGNKHENVHYQKPNTKSLKKDDRDMKARDNLRRKRLKEESDYEAI